MKHYLYLFLFLFGSSCLWSQDSKRLLVNGEVKVLTNDVEGISVYNASTNKGTITNNKGAFVIEVGLNDKLEISALQFRKRTIIVDAIIIKNKSLKIYLVENINNLEEVTVLPYQLAGYITEDIKTAEVVKPIVFSYDNFEDYEFSADYKTSVENIALEGKVLENGLNVVNVLNLLIRPLFKNKKKDNNSNLPSVKNLSNKYTNHFLSNGFNIPDGEAGLFIEYVENNGLTSALLEKGNEMKLVAFLHEKSKQFLLETRDKD